MRVLLNKFCFSVSLATCLFAMVASVNASNQSQQLEEKSKDASAANYTGATKTKNKDTVSRSFLTNLSSLCGKKFEGKTVFPSDPNHDFAGKQLIMFVKDCSSSQIRIPFSVGSDKSRTWLITATENGLQLKHDHRHEDGTPHELTMYGGDSDQVGTQWRQSFPADQLTYQLVPKGKTNIWTLEIDLESQTFWYRLTRHGKKRYSASFDLSKPLK